MVEGDAGRGEGPPAAGRKPLPPHVVRRIVNASSARLQALRGRGFKDCSTDWPPREEAEGGRDAASRTPGAAT